MENIRLDNITIDEVRLRGGTAYSVLRLDKIHPLISGNKWYKLHHYLNRATDEGKRGIITFGGAYSNHILATAAACRMAGLQSVGIIRGEEPRDLSPTLTEATTLGMQLCFVSREAYREKQVPPIIDEKGFLLVAEGGYGSHGAAGAMKILDGLRGRYTHIICAVGTGTTMAGLINAQPDSHVIGISVMKNNHSLHQHVSALLNENHVHWNINHDYHFGGYARHPAALIQFMNDFYALSKIPTDIVYTGRLFFAVNDLIRKGHFSNNDRILVIHSGGLQGNNSLQKGTLMY